MTISGKEQDRLWEELKELRHDVKEIRSKTDRLEARAGAVGAIVAFAISAAGVLFNLFWRRA